MKKLTVLCLALVMIVGVILAATAGNQKEKGFNSAGYNRVAGIFNGTIWEWCMDKVGSEDWCEENYGKYANDKLIMKWNSEWERGNEEDWSNPPYDAWLIDHYNGNVPGGSGETWHFKIVWDKGCANKGIPSREVRKGTAQCLWGEDGQFALVMGHGTVDNEHLWEVLLNPAGM